MSAHSASTAPDSPSPNSSRLIPFSLRHTATHSTGATRLSTGTTDVNVGGDCYNTPFSMSSFGEEHRSNRRKPSVRRAGSEISLPDTGGRPIPPDEYAVGDEAANFGVDVDTDVDEDVDEGEGEEEQSVHSSERSSEYQLRRYKAAYATRRFSETEENMRSSDDENQVEDEDEDEDEDAEEGKDEDSEEGKDEDQQAEDTGPDKAEAEAEAESQPQCAAESGVGSESLLELYDRQGTNDTKSNQSSPGSETHFEAPADEETRLAQARSEMEKRIAARRALFDFKQFHPVSQRGCPSSSKVAEGNISADDQTLVDGEEPEHVDLGIQGYTDHEQDRNDESPDNGSRQIMDEDNSANWTDSDSDSAGQVETEVLYTHNGEEESDDDESDGSEDDHHSQRGYSPIIFARSVSPELCRKSLISEQRREGAASGDVATADEATGSVAPQSRWSAHISFAPPATRTDEGRPTPQSQRAYTDSMSFGRHDSGATSETPHQDQEYGQGDSIPDRTISGRFNTRRSQVLANINRRYPNLTEVETRSLLHDQLKTSATTRVDLASATGQRAHKHPAQGDQGRALSGDWWNNCEPHW